MEWLNLIPMVVSLVSVVEKLVTGAKQGAVKKAVVEGAAVAAIDVWSATSAGGQKATAEAFRPVVGNLIDAVVALNNLTGWIPSIVDESLEVRRQAGVL